MRPTKNPTNFSGGSINKIELSKDVGEQLKNFIEVVINDSDVDIDCVLLVK